MYEDALECSNEALRIQPDNSKALLRNARSLAFLFEFKKATNILNGIKKQKGVKEEIQNVKLLES